MITFAAITLQGPRPIHEDAILVPGLLSMGESVGVLEQGLSPVGACLFAVVDGMGGQAGGRQASRIVCEALGEAQPPPADSAGLVSLLETANARLYHRMARDERLVGMGATVAGLVLHSGGALVFNVGDARVYQHEGGFSVLLTTDDRRAASSHFVTQSLGGMDRPTAIVPHVTGLAPAARARFLICTDGLSDCLGFLPIQGALSASSPRLALDNLVTRAENAGLEDNLSAIVIDAVTGDAAACGLGSSTSVATAGQLEGDRP